MIIQPLQRSFPPRRRTERWVGRTRRRLGVLMDEAFKAAGLDVEINLTKLWPAQGRWRSDKRMDVCSWEGQVEVMIAGRRQTRSVCCWDTMSECVRHGVDFQVDGFDYEFFALPLKSARPARAQESE